MENIFAELRQLSAEQRELMLRMLEKDGVDLTRLPLPVRTQPDRAPMSATQHRLWALHELSKGLPTENVPVAIELTGELNIDALAASVGFLVERHAILRTTFHGGAATPEQRIHPAGEFSLPVVDLAKDDTEAEEAAVSAALVAEGSRLFDLETDWLMRPVLFRLAPERHLLLLTFHQLVVDGWAVNVIAHELGVAYEAFNAGKQPGLEAQAVQYADFAEWQQEGWEDSLADAQLEYWVSKLAGAPPLVKIPTGRRRPAAPGFSGGLRLVEFNASTVAPLRELARKEGVTMFTAVLATLKVLLRAYSGQQDIVVGTLTSRRGQVEAENMVGNFGNNLLLRSVLPDSVSFRDVLKTVNETILDAIAHQDVSLDDINIALQNRAGQRIPAFQMGFIFRDGQLHDRLQITGVDVRQRFVDLGTARLDLWFDLADQGAGLSGEIIFRDDLLDSRQVDMLIGHWAEAMSRLAGFPDLPLAEIEIFPESQGLSPARARVVEELMNSHPAVECARVNSPGALVGGPATIMFVRSGAAEVTGTELRDWVSSKLDATIGPAMFREVDALPDATNDDEAGAPDPGRRSSPETELEREVAAIWSAALGIQNIYADDNFFDLGGHSLLAVQVLKRLREIGAVPPDPKSLVTGTLRQLTVQMSGDSPGEGSRNNNSDSADAPVDSAGSSSTIGTKRGLLGKLVTRLT